MGHTLRQSRRKTGLITGKDYVETRIMAVRRGRGESMGSLKEGGGEMGTVIFKRGEEGRKDSSKQGSKELASLTGKNRI